MGVRKFRLPNRSDRAAIDGLATMNASNPILEFPIGSIDQNHLGMLYEEALYKFQDWHSIKFDSVRSDTFSISIGLIQSSFLNDIPNSHQSLIEF